MVRLSYTNFTWSILEYSVPIDECYSLNCVNTAMPFSDFPRHIKLAHEALALKKELH